MIMDIMQADNFYYLTVAGAKMSLFLELVMALLCMLIIKGRIS